MNPAILQLEDQFTYKADQCNSIFRRACTNATCANLSSLKSVTAAQQKPLTGPQAVVPNYSGSDDARQLAVTPIIR